MGIASDPTHGTDSDTYGAGDDNLPVIDNITGQIRTLSGHKVDGSLTN